MKHLYPIRKTLMIVFALLAALSLGACSQASHLLDTAAEVTPTPMPVQTLPPVITYGDAMPLPMTDESLVPIGYTRVEAGNPDIALFAFTDAQGATQYRVYGGYVQYVDGIAGDTSTGFYPSDETGALPAERDAFVDPSGEPFGVCEIQPLPETIRLRTVYTMLESGLITSTSGLSFVYGSFNGGEGAFYPATSSGAMIPGALPTGEHISVPSYTPEEPPAEEGELLIRVYIGTQSIVVYKAVNGEWTEERVMICSTGRSKDMTPRGTFHLVRQYPYKKMGEIAGENVYSQYASRIVSSYLFHSVPIGGKSRQNPENGKRQMFVSLYEKLGTFASGGCVRLLCKDAYWMYMNCPVGTTIFISDDNGPTPPEPPALIYEEPYMDARQEYGWDPTDPDPANPYHAIYPPEFVLDGPVVDKSKD